MKPMNSPAPPPAPDQDPNQFMYQRYVSSGGFGPVPAEQADLAPRMPLMRDLVRRFFPADRDAEILDLGCGNRWPSRIASVSPAFARETCSESWGERAMALSTPW
jgi:hypothetical protein